MELLCWNSYISKEEQRERLLRRLEKTLEVLSGIWKKENDGMITCSITKKQ
jgi:hypothetical protein